MSSVSKNIGSRTVAADINTPESLPVAPETFSGDPILHAYQDDLVRKGLEEMRAGRVVSHEEVLRRLRR